MFAGAGIVVSYHPSTLTFILYSNTTCTNDRVHNDHRWPVGGEVEQDGGLPVDLLLVVGTLGLATSGGWAGAYGGGGQDEEGEDLARLFYVQTSAAGVVLEYPGTRKQPLCGTPLSPESQVVDIDVSMSKDGRRWEC